MLGLMMDKPLLISSVLDYAAKYHGGTEIVSRTVEGPIHRYLCGSLGAVKETRPSTATAWHWHGGPVATLAWNGFRHFELYFEVYPAWVRCAT